MELLNRSMQLELLRAAAARYPEPMYAEHLTVDTADRGLAVNAMYLGEHGLCNVSLRRYLEGGTSLGSLTITAKGLDFLQDDGGLGAVLNVVTVKLDATTLRALIEEKVEASELPPQEKSRLITWLKSAGSEALKEATQRLVQAALDQAPDALRLLQTLPG